MPINPSHAELLDERHRAHLVFDRIWRGSDNPRYIRACAYKWLAHRLSLSLDECHFSRLTTDQCRRAIRLSRHVSARDVAAWFRRQKNLTASTTKRNPSP